MSHVPPGYAPIPGDHHGGARRVLPDGSHAHWYPTRSLARAAYRRHRHQAAHLRDLHERTEDPVYAVRAGEHEAHARGAQAATFGDPAIDALDLIERIWAASSEEAADAVSELRAAHDDHLVAMQVARSAYVAAVERAHGALSAVRAEINALHDSFADLSSAASDVVDAARAGLEVDDEGALDAWLDALDARSPSAELDVAINAFPTPAEVLESPVEFAGDRGEENWFDDDERGVDVVADEVAAVLARPRHGAPSTADAQATPNREHSMIRVLLGGEP